MNRQLMKNFFEKAKYKGLLQSLMQNKLRFSLKNHYRTGFHKKKSQLMLLEVRYFFQMKEVLFVLFLFRQLSQRLQTADLTIDYVLVRNPYTIDQTRHRPRMLLS